MKWQGQMGQIKASLNLSQVPSHVAMVKAQIYVGFALNSLTKEAQAVTSRNDSLAILRLFEPDTDDELWKLQKHIHDVTWRLYDSCGVHHVSTEKGIDIYMLVEKEYPLSRGTLTLMLVAKLLVDQNNEISKELLRKILMQDTIDVEINSLLDIKIQSEVPHIQSPSVLRVPVSMISKPSVFTPVQESPLVAPLTNLPPLSDSTIPPVPQKSTTPIPTPPITNDAPIITTDVLKSDALTAVQQIVAKLKKDVSKLLLLLSHKPYSETLCDANSRDKQDPVNNNRYNIRILEKCFRDSQDQEGTS
ncbi:hypothetical protein Tco_0070685 [Tanacetum coccineum]